MTICPVRCFTCGKVTGNKWQTYQKLIESGVSPSEALDKLGLKRYCCRRIILTHLEIVDKLLDYSVENRKKVMVDITNLKNW
jgi:DNA-directed RNA polymerases I, II, and III subunit RPABC5